MDPLALLANDLPRSPASPSRDLRAEPTRDSRPQAPRGSGAEQAEKPFTDYLDTLEAEPSNEPTARPRADEPRAGEDQAPGAATPAASQRETEASETHATPARDAPGTVAVEEETPAAPASEATQSPGISENTKTKVADGTNPAPIRGEIPVAPTPTVLSETTGEASDAASHETVAAVSVRTGTPPAGPARQALQNAASQAADGLNRAALGGEGRQGGGEADTPAPPTAGTEPRSAAGERGAAPTATQHLSTASATTEAAVNAAASTAAAASVHNSNIPALPADDAPVAATSQLAPTPLSGEPASATPSSLAAEMLQADEPIILAPATNAAQRPDPANTPGKTARAAGDTASGIAAAASTTSAAANTATPATAGAAATAPALSNTAAPAPTAMQTDANIPMLPDPAPGLLADGGEAEMLRLANGELAAPGASQTAASARAAPSITVRLGGQVPTAPGAMADLGIHIARAARDGVHRFEIRLDPPELGRIDMRLEMAADGRLQAHFTAERPETLELLQRDARALERMLSDQGVKTDSGSLSFSLRDERMAGEERTGAGRAGTYGGEDEPDPETLIFSGETGEIWIDGRVGVDLTV